MVLLGTDRKLINNPFVLLQSLLATPPKWSLPARFLYRLCCEFKWPVFEYLTPVKPWREHFLRATLVNTDSVLLDSGPRAMGSEVAQWTQERTEHQWVPPVSCSRFSHALFTQQSPQPWEVHVTTSTWPDAETRAQRWSCTAGKWWYLEGSPLMTPHCLPIRKSIPHLYQ